MRWGGVKVDMSMRDAWLQRMRTAFDKNNAAVERRTFLDARHAELADFLRNAPGGRAMERSVVVNPSGLRRGRTPLL